jgi:hypothetical protein
VIFDVGLEDNIRFRFYLLVASSRCRPSAAHQPALLQLQEDLSHLLILGRSHAGNGIPLGTRREALSAAARIRADGDIIEHAWVLIDCGVQKPNRAFARGHALLVEQVDDAGKDGRRGRRAANAARLVEVHGREVEAQRGHVRVGAAGGVEDGLAVRRRVFLEVLGHGFGLPRGLWEDAGEATAGVVREETVGRGDGLFTAVDGRVEEGCCADGRDLEAC